MAPVPDAQSPRDMETHGSPQPQLQIKHQPQPRAESEPSEPAPHEAPSLAAASSDADGATPHDHLDLSDLVAHLSSIAESLGIDISEFDSEPADELFPTGPPHAMTVR